MKSPSASTWRRAIKQARDGNAQPLLELLLTPTMTDSSGAPLPGAFNQLPDDFALRYEIIRALMLGPWRGASTMRELMTRTGWGKRGRPRLSDREVDFAAVALRLGGRRMTVEDIAAGLDIEPDTLRRRIGGRRAKKRPKYG